MAGLVLALLTGCFPLLPTGGTGGTGGTVETDGPTGSGDAPDGWATFANCDGGPNVDWVWVDGFPAEAFEQSGVDPVCGDVWPQPDGETFLGVAHYGLTAADLDAFETAILAAGYVRLWDDFDPTVEQDYAGARDYYLDGVGDGDFTRLAVEIYANPLDDAFTGYFDYLSPLTRDLGP